jgi:LmbE family N-acetylglucosaminyl deacetylase
VVAHPDDEVLGIGGTLARHASEGDTVHVSILSDGVTSRYEDPESEDATSEIERRRRRAQTAVDHLGVDALSLNDYPDNEFDTVPLLDLVQTVEASIEEINPEVVYTHHHGDLNVDHELTCRAVLTATRPLSDSGVRRVLGAETLSSTEWAAPEPGNAFQPHVFRDISSTLDEKLDALEVYENELREPPHPRTVETVRQNAEVWGAKAGVTAAEPFVLLREVS